jgi:hypothetical protein
MNQAIVDTWSDSEQAIARSALQKAYERAVAQLAAAVQAQASALSTVESIWALHDFLSIERHTMEGRFDFRLEGILFVFASLVKENLLHLQELDGLDAEKLAKVAAMARF